MLKLDRLKITKEILSGTEREREREEARVREKENRLWESKKILPQRDFTQHKTTIDSAWIYIDPRISALLEEPLVVVYIGEG